MSKKIYETPVITVTEFNSDSITSVGTSSTANTFTKISALDLTNSNAIDF